MDINDIKEIIFYLSILRNKYKIERQEGISKRLLKLIYKLQMCIDYYEGSNNRWEQISMEEYNGHEI